MAARGEGADPPSLLVDIYICMSEEVGGDDYHI